LNAQFDKWYYSVFVKCDEKIETDCFDLFVFKEEGVEVINNRPKYVMEVCVWVKNKTISV